MGGGGASHRGSQISFWLLAYLDAWKCSLDVLPCFRHRWRVAWEGKERPAVEVVTAALPVPFTSFPERHGDNHRPVKVLVVESLVHTAAGKL